MGHDVLETRLAINEQRKRRLEQHIARQRTVIAALEAAQRGNSETAENLRELLRIMERNLRLETIEHRQLRGQLLRQSREQGEARKSGH